MIEPTDFVALGALGGVRDLGRIVHHLAPRSSAYRVDAALAAGQILGRATVSNIVWLAHQRALGSGDYGWCTLSPADLGEPPLRADSLAAPVVALASMHPSGYVREAATRLLATRVDGAEVPYLLLRVNDWVPEVRDAAMGAVRERAHWSYAKHFVPCLGLVEGVRGWSRNRLSGLADDIERLIAGEGTWGALLEALSSSEADVRRTAARLAVRAGDPVLVLRAATAKDPVVAALGARAAVASWSDGGVRELIPALRRGSPALRWIALAAVCDRLPREAEAHLREALLDSSTSLRELARYRWEKVGLPPLDFAGFYRQAISERTASARMLAVAMRGLAETATPADGALFEGYLHHPSAPVRAAAVLGLGRTRDARFNEALASAMEDPSPRVAAEARRWVKIRLGRAAVRLRPRR